MERNKMERPFVVCHMLASLDGKIDGAFFGERETAPALKAYGALREAYSPQATVYGTTTMLGGYADGPAPQQTQVQTGNSSRKEDFVSLAGKAVGNFVVSMDPGGTLGFSSHVLEKKGRPAAHVVEILTERASPAYLSYLRKLGISYLFAGKDRISCTLLVQKLMRLFGVDRLMVAGGGVTNWSFLQEGLMDELSLVVVPVVDGGTTAVSCFERAGFFPPHGPVPFRLKEARPLDAGVLWLRYELSVR